MKLSECIFNIFKREEIEEEEMTIVLGSKHGVQGFILNRPELPHNQGPNLAMILLFYGV